MIQVLALTQFAFLALGIVVLKILMHSTDPTATERYLWALNTWSLFLFAVPLAWMAFAAVCVRVERWFLTTRVARVSGFLLAVLCFAFLVAVTFLVS